MLSSISPRKTAPARDRCFSLGAPAERHAGIYGSGDMRVQRSGNTRRDSESITATPDLFGILDLATWSFSGCCMPHAGGIAVYQAALAGATTKLCCPCNKVWYADSPRQSQDLTPGISPPRRRDLPFLIRETPPQISTRHLRPCPEARLVLSLIQSEHGIPMQPAAICLFAPAFPS